jgi:hypothetical protein
MTFIALGDGGNTYSFIVGVLLWAIRMRYPDMFFGPSDPKRLAQLSLAVLSGNPDRTLQARAAGCPATPGPGSDFS